MKTISLLALILPLTQLILMGSSISLDVKDMPLAVQDFDNSPASRALIDAFRESITFQIIPSAVDQRPEESFLSNEARAVLIIPKRFGRDLARGVNSPITGPSRRSPPLVATTSSGGYGCSASAIASSEPP